MGNVHGRSASLPTSSAASNREGRKPTTPKFGFIVFLGAAGLPMASGPDDDDSFPPLRKPSQLYVDNYIARSGTTPAPRTAALTPRQGPARKAARIFYPLEDKCPAHYYPDLHLVNDVWMLRTRRALQLMCTMQVVMSVVLLLYSSTLHNPIDKTFTFATNLLGIVSAVLGFVGVLLNYRTLLLFLYINELFGLSNVRCAHHRLSSDA